jgi:hypothetical protein
MSVTKRARRRHVSDSLNFFALRSRFKKAHRPEQYLVWLQRLSCELQEWVDLPAPDVPDLGAGDFRLLRERDIEEAAFQVRAHWGLGRASIPDMLLVLENAGIVCGRCFFGAPSIDGVSHWSRADDRPYVLISSDKRTAVRSRFDAAHELGHLVLHRHVDPRLLVDRDAFNLNPAIDSRKGAKNAKKTES